MSYKQCHDDDRGNIQLVKATQTPKIFAKERAEIKISMNDQAEPKPGLTYKIETVFLSDNQIKSIITFASQIKSGLVYAGNDFTEQRWIVEQLNCTG